MRGICPALWRQGQSLVIVDDTGTAAPTSTSYPQTPETLTHFLFTPPNDTFI